MSVRYLYNTSGQYVAFLKDGHLFAPSGEWIGFIANGNEVYRPGDGSFLGVVTADDRVIRNRNDPPRPPKPRPPFRPFHPFRPFAPFRRLRMPPLPPPFIDVFADAALGEWNAPAVGAQFERLLGARIVAANGVFLGVVSRDRFDPNSISNQFGEYGSRFSATSIFNEFGNYGGQFSLLSPFNRFTQTPPTFVRDGQVLGVLSSNQFVRGAIDTNSFVSWLRGAT